MDGLLIGGASRLLREIEGLPPNATGILKFGSRGVVLLENRAICWAVAKDMERRLHKLLRQQRSPPLEEDLMNRVIQECRNDGTPLGEALLRTGHITEAGLRGALYSHIVEAIARIAATQPQWESFVPCTSRRFQARFVFHTSEILAGLGARVDRALAAAAKRTLQTALVPETRGVAFVRSDSGAVPIAVGGSDSIGVAEALEVCAWAANLFDVSSMLDESVTLAMGTTGRGEAVITWRNEEAHFLAVCGSRAAAARLMTHLETTLPSSKKAHS